MKRRWRGRKLASEARRSSRPKEMGERTNALAHGDAKPKKKKEDGKAATKAASGSVSCCTACNLGFTPLRQVNERNRLPVCASYLIDVTLRPCLWRLLASPLS